MSGSKLLLDTNIVLYLLNGDKTLAELLDKKQVYLSFITELELLGYKGIKKEEEKSVREFVGQCRIININSEIKKETILVRKSYNLKLPDSIISATAIYLGLPLVSSDIDFKKIKELKLLLYQN